MAINLQAAYDQERNRRYELEAELAKLRKAALLYSIDIGHSHACKATIKTVGVCICGYEALVALLEDK